MTSEEKSLLETQNALKPLLVLNPLNYNPYTEALWKASIAQYENNMASAKKSVASKLRNQLRSSRTNPLQVCVTFRTNIFFNLICLGFWYYIFLNIEIKKSQYFIHLISNND